MKSLKIVGVLMILLFEFVLQAQGQRFLSSCYEYTYGGDSADSAEFAYYLGSVEEFNYQVARAYDEEYRESRIQFIDSKFGYSIWFVFYTYGIGATGSGVEIEEFTNRLVLTIGVSYIGERIPPVVVDMELNEDMRIQKADITGGPQTLLKIFKHQWWVSDDDMRAVQKGTKFTVSRWNEKVTFDWTGEEHVIKIRGNSVNNLKDRIEGK